MRSKPKVHDPNGPREGKGLGQGPKSLCLASIKAYSIFHAQIGHVSAQLTHSVHIFFFSILYYHTLSFKQIYYYNYVKLKKTYVILTTLDFRINNIFPHLHFLVV